MLRNSRPWFFENSRIPIWLSYLAPIDIGAITIGPFVFSRGEMSETTKNHEAIHWQQYIETGIVGFVILYYWYWFINLLKYRDGKRAYYEIPFEREAYLHDWNLNYLQTRKRFTWWRLEEHMGAGIIIMAYDNDEPKILGLIGDAKHQKKHGAIYDLPKGSTDPGESNWAAAVRETFEETGITVHEKDLVDGPVNDSWLTMWMSEVTIDTPIKIGVNPVTGKLEHNGYRWLSKEDAMNNCYPYLRQFVSWAFDNF